MREKAAQKPAPAQTDVPLGIVRSAADVGAWVRSARKAAGKTLVETAALTGVGVRDGVAESGIAKSPAAERCVPVIRKQARRVLRELGP